MIQYILLILILILIFRIATILFDLVLFTFFVDFTNDSPHFLADFMTSLSFEISFLMIIIGAYNLYMMHWIIGLIFIILWYPAGNNIPIWLATPIQYIQIVLIRRERNEYKHVRPSGVDTALSAQKYGISLALYPIIIMVCGLPTTWAISIVMSGVGLIVWAISTYFTFRKAF